MIPAPPAPAFPAAVTKGNALAGTWCSILPESGNYHFALSGCDDCTIRDLRRRSLDWVEDRYRNGYVGQAMWEAYTHVWATGAARFGSYPGWNVTPTDPEVVALVARLRGEAPAGPPSVRVSAWAALVDG